MSRLTKLAALGALVFAGFGAPACAATQTPIPSATASTSSSDASKAEAFSAQEIRRVVMAHTGAIRACYEHELDTEPTLAGSFTVRWHISASGAVAKVWVIGKATKKSQPMMEVVAGCMTEVRRWVFANPDGLEADAAWGYVFNPPKP